jgi:hypothetical protein
VRVGYQKPGRDGGSGVRRSIENGLWRGCDWFTRGESQLLGHDENRVTNVCFGDWGRGTELPMLVVQGGVLLQCDGKLAYADRSR